MFETSFVIEYCDTDSTYCHDKSKLTVRSLSDPEERILFSILISFLDNLI